MSWFFKSLAKMHSRSLIASSCILFTIISQVWSQDPMVLTNQGVVRGSWSSSGDFSMFMGIPYALVNQENPFGDAMPGPKFEGIFEAHDDGAICPQIEEFNNTVTGNLDCLHVNVYVPRSASVSNPLPVLVWIYGGGFSFGFAGQYLYGPQYLVRHNIILVTINYRLGPYGFMCLDIPTVSGNSGLKDQRRGLEWVQENIGAFGGDKTKVTIFGESAGAVSIDYHVLSPRSNGLFHRAILQSGTSLLDALLMESRPSAPIELCTYLGNRAETVEEALEILKDVPTNDIILAAKALGIQFHTCVEKTFDGVESVITDFPENILASGQYEALPMIIGYNSDEKLADHLSEMNRENYFDQYKNVFYDRLNASFKFSSEEELERISDIVKQFYMGTESINEATIYELIEFESDILFINPIERLIKHYEKSNVPIYQYVFGYSGQINFVKQRKNITEGGAVHADDIAFLFKLIYSTDENRPEDQLVIDRMTTMWANFVKYGDPTPEVSELLPVRWPTVTEEREYLWIDSDLQVDRKPYHGRVAFWDLIFETIGKYFRYV